MIETTDVFDMLEDILCQCGNDIKQEGFESDDGVLYKCRRCGKVYEQI
jgi:uncharacterized Zn finger protein